MIKLYYAGIGSRETPMATLQLMQRLASRLAARGYELRSGAANGADTAFELGCSAVNGPCEIWLPWAGFNGHADTGFYPGGAHMEKAASLHPAWSRLSIGPQKLHARNVGQVLGEDLATPVSFVLCWTKDGCATEQERTVKTGGTGTAIVLAHRLGIPVFNLGAQGAYENFVDFVLRAARTFHVDATAADLSSVFVFGSNLAGRHGKGAAKLAKENYGAETGIGEGLMIKSYAIPTKDIALKTLPLPQVKKSVETFIAFAKQHQDVPFFVTRIGCGLAGYSNADIAPMFALAPSNCSFAKEWEPWIGVNKKQT